MLTNEELPCAALPYCIREVLVCITSQQDQRNPYGWKSTRLISLSIAYCISTAEHSFVQAFLKSSSTIREESSHNLIHDETTVFEILPGKLGKLLGEDVRVIAKDRIVTILCD